VLGSASCKASDPDTGSPLVVDLAATADLATTPLPDLAIGAPAPDTQYNDFVMYQRPADFAGWTLSGTAVGSSANGDAAAIALSPVPGTPLSCNSEEIDGGAANYDPASGLCAGNDPMPSGLPTGVTYYNGSRFYYGTLRSPEIHPAQPIGTIIASWNATTPMGTWIAVHVRAQLPSGWTRWYSLPVWTTDVNTVKRHSVSGSSDADGYVDTDTFMLKSGQLTTAYQLQLTLFAADPRTTPTVRMVAAIASRDEKKYLHSIPDATVWGRELAVPQRSQALPEYKGLGYGGGGEVWCSPTSTSMVMAYWSGVTANPTLNQTVPDTAAGCYDWVYDGTGNWPFNTAHAASFGLTGYVTRLYSFADAESYIKAGVPLILSIAFKPGELPGAPISQTNGHLIVLRGFDKNGDPIANDPAARDNASVRIVYPRTPLENAWSHSNHTVYVIYPPGYPAPLPDVH
jgi:hypothetical protein